MHIVLILTTSNTYSWWFPKMTLGICFIFLIEKSHMIRVLCTTTSISSYVDQASFEKGNTLK